MNEVMQNLKYPHGSSFLEGMMDLLYSRPPELLNDRLLQEILYVYLRASSPQHFSIQTKQNADPPINND